MAVDRPSTSLARACLYLALLAAVAGVAGAVGTLMSIVSQYCAAPHDASLPCDEGLTTVSYMSRVQPMRSAPKPRRTARRMRAWAGSSSRAEPPRIYRALVLDAGAAWRPG